MTLFGSRQGPFGSNLELTFFWSLLDLETPLEGLEDELDDQSWQQESGPSDGSRVMAQRVAENIQVIEFRLEILVNSNCGVYNISEVVEPDQHIVTDKDMESQEEIGKEAQVVVDEWGAVLAVIGFLTKGKKTKNHLEFQKNEKCLNDYDEKTNKDQEKVFEREFYRDFEQRKGECEITFYFEENVDDVDSKKEKHHRQKFEKNLFLKRKARYLILK